MDSGSVFTLVMVGIFLFLILFVLALGKWYPGSGAQQVDWRPTRSPEVEAQNEVDDVAQMLEAANERRRRRGAEPLTEEGLSARVRADERELRQRRESLLAEREVEQLLEQRNERRRAKGLPEQGLDDLKAELGLD